MNLLVPLFPNTEEKRAHTMELWMAISYFDGQRLLIKINIMQICKSFDMFC